mmetsp:Transcript_17525/g.52955  ORF Transcript_17525/g.52955 Transcript_17525/m.52955 type:complete len:236 (+) Transcript_17525:940-1647(+)|eukprot:scaffold41701_cov31-Tisochrysis_lutea.AAC.2
MRIASGVTSQGTVSAVAKRSPCLEAPSTALAPRFVASPAPEVLLGSLAGMRTCMRHSEAAEAGGSPAACDASRSPKASSEAPCVSSIGEGASTCSPGSRLGERAPLRGSDARHLALPLLLRWLSLPPSEAPSEHNCTGGTVPDASAEDGPVVSGSSRTRHPSRDSQELSATGRDSGTTVEHRGVAVRDGLLMTTSSDDASRWSAAGRSGPPDFFLAPNNACEARRLRADDPRASG